MPLFDRHVFVCNNTRDPSNPRGCCSAKGGDEIREAFKRELKNRGLNKRIRTNQAGCLDQCEHGAVVVVYPEQVWYGGVQASDVPEIVEKHLVGGEPVARLQLAETCVNSASCPHRAKG